MTCFYLHTSTTYNSLYNHLSKLESLGGGPSNLWFDARVVLVELLLQYFALCFNLV